MKLIVALSGPIGVGKSTFADELVREHGAKKVSTRAWLIAEQGIADDRGALQQAGERLDRDTRGAWVADMVEAAVRAVKDELLLVDSVRTAEQVAELRSRFGDRLVHVHLTAEPSEIERRYLERAPAIREFSTYAEARTNGTEARVRELVTTAHLVLDTDHADARTLADTAMAWAGRPRSTTEALVDVIVGGQYGSEGKGNVVAHLASGYGALMRVGGPNAGHLVADPFYKYVQLPSGTGSNGEAKILVGAGSTLWLPQLMLEIMDRRLGPDRLSIDLQAIVIDDEDRRIESDSLSSIASTKQGVGSATARKILNRGKVPILGPRVTLAKDVPQLAPFVRDVRSELDQLFASGLKVMLEGTQGTTLSIHHGLWPSVTSRETSAAGCLSDAGIAPGRVRKVVMVVRTYPIQVGGTSGWMGREIDLEAVAKRSGITIEELKAVEKGTISGNQRRIAEFDWAQLRRSAVINGATDIALTFADYLTIANRDAARYADLDAETRRFVERVEAVAQAPVSLISKKFAKDGVIDRRSWK